MPLTLLSTTPSATRLAPNTGGAAGEASSSSGALDFAALLIQQIGHLAPPSPLMPASGKPDAAPEEMLSPAQDPLAAAWTGAFMPPPASSLPSQHAPPPNEGQPILPGPQEGPWPILPGQGEAALAGRLANQTSLMAENPGEKPASFAGLFAKPEASSATPATLAALSALAGNGAEKIADLEASLLAPRPEPSQPGDFSAHLVAQLAANGAVNGAASGHPAESAAGLQIRTPLQDARWSQDFGEKILWASRNDQHSAQINITPPQLGPIQINLTMNGDQVTASFVSAHGEVRQAIEDSLPRLRELFANAGLQLGDANVGAQQQSPGGEKPPQFADPGRETSRLAGDNAILRASDHQITMPVPAAIQRGRGMVDLFA